MSEFDPLVKYREYKRTEGGYAPASVPRASEVLAAHRLRKKLYFISAAILVVGLLALFVTVPTIFFLVVQILGIGSVVVGGVYGVVRLFMSWSEVADTFGRAKIHGVVEDD